MPRARVWCGRDEKRFSYEVDGWTHMLRVFKAAPAMDPMLSVELLILEPERPACSGCEASIASTPLFGTRNVKRCFCIFLL